MEYNTRHSFSFSVLWFYSSHVYLNLEIDYDCFQCHGLLQAGIIKVYILSMFYVPDLTHSNHSFKLELRDLSLSLIERLYASSHSEVYLIVAACKIMRLL
jgi:hypothetical protein